MPSKPNDADRYDEVWRAAEPYMRARKNDVHIPLSFAFARRLLGALSGGGRGHRVARDPAARHRLVDASTCPTSSKRGSART